MISFLHLLPFCPPLFSSYLFVVLWMKPRVLYMLGDSSGTELHPQPHIPESHTTDPTTLLARGRARQVLLVLYYLGTEVGDQSLAHARHTLFLSATPPAQKYSLNYVQCLS